MHNYKNQKNCKTVRTIQIHINIYYSKWVQKSENLVKLMTDFFCISQNVAEELLEYVFCELSFWLQSTAKIPTSLSEELPHGRLA